MFIVLFFDVLEVDEDFGVLVGGNVAGGGGLVDWFVVGSGFGSDLILWHVERAELLGYCECLALRYFEVVSLQLHRRGVGRILIGMRHDTDRAAVDALDLRYAR